MTEDGRAKIRAVIESLRAHCRQPDERPNDAVWAWRLDEWADQLEVALVEGLEPTVEQAHECDATNIAVAADGRIYCAHCGWNEPTETNEPRDGQAAGDASHGPMSSLSELLRDVEAFLRLTEWSDRNSEDEAGNLLYRIREVALVEGRPAPQPSAVAIALRDLIDAIPESTLEADPPLRAWVNYAEEALRGAEGRAAPQPLDAKYEAMLLDIETRIFYAETSVQTLAESARLLKQKLRGAEGRSETTHDQDAARTTENVYPRHEPSDQPDSAEHRPSARPTPMGDGAEGRRDRAAQERNRPTETEAEGAAVGRPEGPDWKTAALLKDRTRRAIRDRAKAGESVSELATDYGVPETFITHLLAWQLFGDDSPGGRPGNVSVSIG